jgi:hypothetical protein
MAHEHVQELQELPTPASTRLIDFTEVEILTLKSFPPQYVLVVSGTKPYLNVDVSLVPLTYIRRPEYWGIEVIGSVSGIGIPAQAQYTVCLQLNQLGATGFIGTCGIEVIGASRSERHDVSIEGLGPGRLPTELFKHWINSFEESTDEAEVYRPRGFQFPPAFGRRGLEIREDGDFILHAVGPADGTIAIPGHWAAEGSTKIGVCLEGRASVTLTILSVDDDVLRLKRGSGSDL